MAKGLEDRSTEAFTNIARTLSNPPTRPLAWLETRVEEEKAPKKAGGK